MKDLENKLKSIPPRQPSPDYYQRVLDQKPISQKPKTKTHQLSHNRLLPTLAALAACLIAALTLWRLTAGNGAAKAFAAAMNSIKQARTFSCIEIDESTYDGQKWVFEGLYMFKEPDLERREKRSYRAGVLESESVTITDYDKRQILEFNPLDKTAQFHDKSSEYVFDGDTGELRRMQLDDSWAVSLREKLLKVSTKNSDVEDLGVVELEGQPVRMLRSQGEYSTATVWINQQTKLPTQVTYVDNKGKFTITYKSIQIDVVLDDALFSLEPPAGYTLEIFYKDWPDDKMKILAKIKRLERACWMYAGEFKDQYPDDLADLVATDYLTDEALRIAQAPLEEPGGPAAIQYCKPQNFAPSEVKFYETYDPGSNEGVVVCFFNGHCDIISVKTLEQLLMPRTDNKKKISASMIYLQLWCASFARQHEGQYPRELTDLEGFDDYSKRLLKFLQVAPGDDVDGPPVICYRRPRFDAEPSTEITFYEIVDQWPADGAVVCFMNGLCEIIADQKRFEELIK